MYKLWTRCRKIRIKSSQDVILAVGLLIGLCYLPSWLYFLGVQLTGYASGSFTLTVCLVIIAASRLYRNHHRLVCITSLEADRWFGSSLIVFGVMLFPFSHQTLWLQAIFWLIILIGITIQLWGMTFFQTFPGITCCTALSAYPNPGHILKGAWQLLTPTQLLESIMAAIASFALRFVGYPVTAMGPLILFPEHHVKVGWACNGFDMILAMIGVSLLLGYFLGFSRRQSFMLCCCGSFLALTLNIPRLVLMSLAAVYWSPEAFDFWHGSLGGQVFVLPLLLGYYFLTQRQMQVNASRTMN